MKNILLIAAALLIGSNFAIAEEKQDTYNYLYIHPTFSMVDLKGDAAKGVYEKMQTVETEDTNSYGPMGSFSKISADGRMWCQRIPQNAVKYQERAWGTFKCQFTFDSSSGSINKTW